MERHVSIMIKGITYTKTGLDILIETRLISSVIGDNKAQFIENVKECSVRIGDRLELTYDA